MKINVRAEGISTREGAPILKISDATMQMLVYSIPGKMELTKAADGRAVNGRLITPGRIEPNEIDSAVTNASEFIKGYCTLDEHPSVMMLITLLNWCKHYGKAAVWSKA